MSTKYFILTKSSDKRITDNENNQILYLNNSHTFILPYNNLNYYKEKGLFEKDLIEWIKELCSKDKIFLDIGAHTGTYSISLANYVKEVHSFEPQKNTFYALCGSVALSNIDNIICHNTGLGSIDQVGEQTLRIISNDGGGSSLHIKDDESFLREEKIRIKTLDSFELENIGLIKMDVENNELFAIKGAVETLKKSNYPKIMFESNKENNELFDFLTSLGYKNLKLNNYNNMFLATKE